MSIPVDRFYRPEDETAGIEGQEVLHHLKHLPVRLPISAVHAAPLKDRLASLHSRHYLFLNIVGARTIPPRYLQRVRRKLRVDTLYRRRLLVSHPPDRIFRPASRECKQLHTKR